MALWQLEHPKEILSKLFYSKGDASNKAEQTYLESLMDEYTKSQHNDASKDDGWSFDLQVVRLDFENSTI